MKDPKALASGRVGGFNDSWNFPSLSTFYYNFLEAFLICTWILICSDFIPRTIPEEMPVLVAFLASEGDVLIV